MERKKILLVEDDANLGVVVKDFLETEGYAIVLCNDGKSGHTTFLKDKFDLLIIDVMLPYLDGFRLAEIVRKKDHSVPFIFLTAKALQEDKIRGLKLGADDYITKPFSSEELVLRINSILKRSNGNKLLAEEFVFRFGQFEFDYGEKTLSGNNNKVQLTQKEAEVLKMLCLNKNRLLKREIILREVWGENDYFMGRSMDVYIARLRKILKDDPEISIVNVHNSGFKLLTEREA